jgi:protein TonB
MIDAIDEFLAKRRSRHGTRAHWGSAVAALVLHVAVVVFLFVAPRLLAEKPKPIEYVAVELVPPQALGVEAAPPPEPEPEPETEPEPEPEPEPETVLPSPEAKPEAKPAPERSPEPKKEEPPKKKTRRPGSRTGSLSADATSATAVAGVDNPSFTYGYYLDRMVVLIRSKWSRPPLGGGIEVMVHFRVMKDGRVTEPRIVHSSGYNSFDLAGLRAVQAASPLPPLPHSFRDNSLGVNLIFR